MTNLTIIKFAKSKQIWSMAKTSDYIAIVLSLCDSNAERLPIELLDCV